MRPLECIYQDDDLLIINKPSGLAVQGGEKVGVSLIDLLEKQFPPRPFLVHRLDKDTSGLILVAKNQRAASLYSKLLSSDQVRKIYCAVAAGTIPEEAGVIDEDIEVHGETRAALTRFRRLASSSEATLLELHLGTGRMHQIRIHLASIGHPILGDDKYGDFTLNKRLKKERGLKRLLLHAHRLTVPLSSGSSREFTAPFPEAFLPWLEDFGLVDTAQPT